MTTIYWVCPSKKGIKIAYRLHYAQHNGCFPFLRLERAKRLLERIKEQGGRGHIEDDKGNVIKEK